MKTYNRKPLQVEAEKVTKQKAVTVEGFELSDNESSIRVCGNRSQAFPGDYLVYYPDRRYPVIMDGCDFDKLFEEVK